jgi:DNA-binding SARP family transcriptional activator
VTCTTPGVRVAAKGPFACYESSPVAARGLCGSWAPDLADDELPSPQPSPEPASEHGPGPTVACVSVCSSGLGRPAVVTQPLAAIAASALASGGGLADATGPTLAARASAAHRQSRASGSRSAHSWGDGAGDAVVLVDYLQPPGSSVAQCDAWELRATVERQRKAVAIWWKARLRRCWTVVTVVAAKSGWLAVVLRILGPLEAVRDDVPRPLGGVKQRAVLAILTLHRGEVVSGERLVDELWGERAPVSAVKTLHGYVSRLRKTVGADVLQTRGHGYVLTLPAGELDLDRFEQLADEGRNALIGGDPRRAAERLREALSLWRGPALADFICEEFAQAAIARLKEARFATLEDRIDADLALGRHRQLVAELEGLVSEHPLRERLRGQLMLALYRAGRQADALECFRLGRYALVEELGLEPGRALQELESAILRQDESLEASPADQPPSAVATTIGDASGRKADHAPAGDVVVGREQQLDQLRDGLNSAMAGQPVVFMVGGEAGIGKTRLADEFAQEARDQGARVLWGRCWEAGGAPAYWPWVQVLRPLLHGRDNVGLHSLRGTGGASLLALIPELRGASSAPDPPALESDGARFQLFDAVAWLLRDAAAAQPVVIVLDDLHAADTPSLLLLQFVAGQLSDVSVMLAGLYRDDDPGEDRALRACLASLTRERTTRRMRLTGLSAADTATMIEAISQRRVAASVAHAIHAETEGNPLFVGEIVRLLEAEDRLLRPIDELRGSQLPDTVREVIGHRLRRLDLDCRRLLGTASILGREFGLRELAALVDLDEDAVLDAVDEAIRARVLAEAPTVGRLRFSHALVRDTLYEALSAKQRRAGHLRAGDILGRLYAADPEPYLAELAHHFYEALPSADPARAVQHARRAGDRAVALLAYEEAARLYALALRALDLQSGELAEERCALLVALGDARARAGDEPTARETFLQAGQIAAIEALPVLQAQAAVGYGGRMVWARAYNDVHLIPLLEAALQALPAEPSSLRVRLMARLSGALRDHPARERRASLSAQAVEMARGLGDPATLAYALDGHYCATMWPETAEARLSIAEEIVALAQQVRDGERLVAGRLYRVIANMELGRMAAGEEELDTLAEEAGALRQRAQMWLATSSQANLALFQGRFGDARTLIVEAAALGERAQRRDSVLSHRLQRFVLHREAGGDSEIEALIENAAAEFPTRPVFRCALTYLYCDIGEESRAQSAIDHLATDDFAAIQRDNEYLFSLAFLADAVHALGDARAAAVLYDLLVPYAHLNAMNTDEIATGSVSRTLGVLAALMSRWDDASRHFERAIAHNAAMGSRPWTAHSQHDYGRMLLARDRPGDREEAGDLLAVARTEYEVLGMEPWVKQISHSLNEAKATP